MFALVSIYWHIPEENTREKKDGMDKEEEFQLQETVLFPSPNTIIHWFVPEEDTREEFEEEEFQFQEKTMFPKCSLSTIMFQKKTPEKTRRWMMKSSSNSKRRSCSPVPSVPNLLLCSRGRHQRRVWDVWEGGVPIPGKDRVPQVFLIHYYVPEEDTRDECEMYEKEEFQFQEKIVFPKCSLSTFMFQRKTSEKSVRCMRRRSSN